MVTNIWEF